MEGFQVKDDKTPSIDDSLEMLQAQTMVKEAVEKLPRARRPASASQSPWRWTGCGWP